MAFPSAAYDRWKTSPPEPVEIELDGSVMVRMQLYAIVQEPEESFSYSDLDIIVRSHIQEILHDAAWNSRHEIRFELVPEQDLELDVSVAH